MGREKELFSAVRRDKFDKFKRLFRKDDINIMEGGKGLIHVAAECGNKNVVSYLLKEERSIIDDFDEKGYTPLLYAIRSNETGIISLLVDQGADVDLGNFENGIKPIHVAASGNLLGVVGLLMKAKPDIINSIDKFGRTALHFAAGKTSLEMVKLLYEKGADIYAKDSKGRNSLDVAKEKDNRLIVEFLEKKFAVKERNSSGASVVRRNSSVASAVRRNSSILGMILNIFGQVRNELNGRGEYVKGAVNALEELIHALQSNQTIIKQSAKSVLSPVLRGVPIESFTKGPDFLSQLLQLCIKLETQIAEQSGPHEQKVLELLATLREECIELGRNINKSSFTPSVAELVMHSSSNIDTAPRDMSRSSQLSSFAHNESVGDDVFVSGPLFFAQQDESACATDSGQKTKRRSSIGSASDVFVVSNTMDALMKNKGYFVAHHDELTKDLAKLMRKYSKSQSGGQSSKKIDNKPKAHLSDSIRDPISIFSQTESCVNKGKNENDDTFPFSSSYSGQLLRARQKELLSNPRDCGSFMPPFSPSLRRFDLPEDSMHAKKDLLTESDTSASPSSKDISKRRISLALHNRSDDGKLLGVCFDSAVESCKQGNYSGAIEAFGEVFDRRKSVLGYGNYNTVMARYNMAVAFSKQGRHEEALKIFLEMKDNLPKDSPYIESVEHNIDVVLSKQVIPSLMVPEKKREEFLIQFDEDEIVNSSHRSSSASGRTEQEQISCPDSVTGDPNTSMDGVQQVDAIVCSAERQ